MYPNTKYSNQKTIRQIRESYELEEDFFWECIKDVIGGRTQTHKLINSADRYKKLKAIAV